MKIKYLKLIQFGISSLILLSASICIVANNNKINTNKKITTFKTNFTNLESKNVDKLISDLGYVSSYSEDIINKQSSLLSNINNSAFSKIQKYGISKNKYVHHANTLIKDSDNSLRKEKKLIDKILPIIINHPYNYEYYLKSKNYVIPNYNFFLKKSLYNSHQNKTIKNSLYDLNKTSNMNTISLASEEAAFGTKQVSKTGMAVMSAIFKNYHFNANVIYFNSNENTYTFNKISKTSSADIINKDSLKANFLRLNSNTKKYKANQINNKSLATILSDNYYPAYFNQYNDICFKTHLQYKHVGSINPKKNFFTYIVLPILIVSPPILEIKIVGFLLAIKKYRTPKKTFANEHNVYSQQRFDGNNKERYIFETGTVRGIETSHLSNISINTSGNDQAREHVNGEGTTIIPEENYTTGIPTENVSFHMIVTKDVNSDIESEHMIINMPTSFKDNTIRISINSENNVTIEDENDGGEEVVTEGVGKVKIDKITVVSSQPDESLHQLRSITGNGNTKQRQNINRNLIFSRIEQKDYKVKNGTNYRTSEIKTVTLKEGHLTDIQPRERRIIMLNGAGAQLHADITPFITSDQKEVQIPLKGGALDLDTLNLADFTFIGLE